MCGALPSFLGQREPAPSTAVNHNGPHFLLVRDQRERTWPGDKARNKHLRKAVPGRPVLLRLYQMPRHNLIVAGIVGLAVFATTPACATDVPEMTCAEIAAFAQEVAQQKAEGRPLNDMVRRLRRSFGRRDADTEHELEMIARAIYHMTIFSTVSPEEVGSAYQTACDHG